jgi:hypothetical protein
MNLCGVDTLRTFFVIGGYYCSRQPRDNKPQRGSGYRSHQPNILEESHVGI